MEVCSINCSKRSLKSKRSWGDSKGLPGELAFLGVSRGILPTPGELVFLGVKPIRIDKMKKMMHMGPTAFRITLARYRPVHKADWTPGAALLDLQCVLDALLDLR